MLVSHWGQTNAMLYMSVHRGTKRLLAFQPHKPVPSVTHYSLKAISRQAIRAGPETEERARGNASLPVAPLDPRFVVVKI